MLTSQFFIVFPVNFRILRFATIGEGASLREFKRFTSFLAKQLNADFKINSAFKWPDEHLFSNICTQAAGGFVCKTALTKADR